MLNEILIDWCSTHTNHNGYSELKYEHGNIFYLANQYKCPDMFIWNSLSKTPFWDWDELKMLIAGIYSKIFTSNLYERWVNDCFYFKSINKRIRE